MKIVDMAGTKVNVDAIMWYEKYEDSMIRVAFFGGEIQVFNFEERARRDESWGVLDARCRCV